MHNNNFDGFIVKVVKDLMKDKDYTDLLSRIERLQGNITEEYNGDLFNELMFLLTVKEYKLTKAIYDNSFKNAIKIIDKLK